MCNCVLLLFHYTAVDISFDMASDSFDEGGVQDNPICLTISGIPTNGIVVPIVVNVSIVNSTTERCNVQGQARSK